MTVSCSSRTFIDPGSTGPLKVSRFLPASVRTRSTQRRRRSDSSSVSSRASSCRRRERRGAAPAARIAARASSGLANRSLTSRSIISVTSASREAQFVSQKEKAGPKGPALHYGDRCALFLRHDHGHIGAVAPDAKDGGAARRDAAKLAARIRYAADRRAADARDHVALHDAGACRRARRFDVDHHRAADVVVEAKPARDVSRDVAQRHAEAARRFLLRPVVVVAAAASAVERRLLGLEIELADLHVDRLLFLVTDDAHRHRRVRRRDDDHGDERVAVLHRLAVELHDHVVGNGREVALMTPTLTVCARLNGLPMAITQSPGSIWLESPNLISGSV